MHQIEACKQKISDFERLATNYKSLEHILMLNNAVQRKLLRNFNLSLTSSDQRTITEDPWGTSVGLRAIFSAYL